MTRDPRWEHVSGGMLRVAAFHTPEMLQIRLEVERKGRRLGAQQHVSLRVVDDPPVWDAWRAQLLGFMTSQLDTALDDLDEEWTLPQ